MKQHGLFIAPNLLFENPTSWQFRRLLSALESRYDITVLCRPDPLGAEKLLPFADLIKTTDFHGKGSYIGAFVKHHFGGWACIPDEMRWSNNPEMLHLAKHTIAERGCYDFILTLSFPLSAHLLGLSLKKRFDVPWLALFYDPWTDNPYRSHPRPFFKKTDTELERKVALCSDAIIHTNDIMSQIWEEKYHKGNVHTLPFCYTSAMLEELPPLQVCRKEKIHFLYGGLCNEGRNLQDFIKALGLIKQERRTDYKRIDVTVAGTHYTPDIELVKQLSLQEQIHFIGKIPKEEMPALYLNSDIYLVVDNDGVRNVHFPSKLMDCFYYRRPILGLTPEDGCTWQMLQRAGHICVRKGDVQALKAVLLELINNGPSYSFDSDYYKNFTPEAISLRFKNILDTIQ